MKKKLYALMAMLTILCTCFAGVQTACAEEREDFWCGNISDYLSKVSIPTEINDYVNVVVTKHTNVAGSYYYVCSNSPIVVSSNGDTRYITSSKNSSALRYGTTNYGGTWSAVSSSTGVEVYYKGSVAPSGMGNVLSLKGTLVDANGNVLLSGAPAGEYKKDLGYLKNLTLKIMTVVGNEQDKLYKFTFEPTTTTGIDLTTGAYKIRVYGSLAYYSIKTGALSVNGGERIEVGEYSISNNSITFKIQDAWNAVTNGSEVLSTWDESMLGLTRCDFLYLQVVNTETGDYGGLVKFSNTKNTTGKPDTITTVTPEGEADSDGYVGEYIPSGDGTGTTPEDAEMNADKDLEDAKLDGYDNLQGQLNSFTENVKAVPQVISSIFGFLPDWCLGLFATSIGLAGVLLVWKALRG